MGAPGLFLARNGWAEVRRQQTVNLGSRDWPTPPSTRFWPYIDRDLPILDTLDGSHPVLATFCCILLFFTSDQPGAEQPHFLSARDKKQTVRKPSLAAAQQQLIALMIRIYSGVIFTPVASTEAIIALNIRIYSGVIFTPVASTEEINSTKDSYILRSNIYSSRHHKNIAIR